MSEEHKRVVSSVTSLIKRIGFWKCPQCGKEFSKPVEGHACRPARKTRPEKAKKKR
jgi:transposase-like protein